MIEFLIGVTFGVLMKEPVERLAKVLYTKAIKALEKDWVGKRF